MTYIAGKLLVRGGGRLLPYLAVMSVALLIGTVWTSSSGPLWADEPRYTNGAAMIHDWLLSGRFLAPYQFAKENYAQYPAFSIPYHPPGFPGLMGLFFLCTTLSYQSARIFIALCSGLLGCLFYFLLRQGHITKSQSLLCSLLLLSTPEVAKWSRTAMSEIPSTMVVLAASVLFLKWFEKDRAVYLWMAFAFAGFAFLCRITTAGVLPGWILFVLLMGQSRRLISWHIVVPGLLYLTLGAAYVLWAATFAHFEVNADGRGAIWSLYNLTYFTVALAPMLYWGTTLFAVLGLLRILKLRRQFPVGLFFLSWLVSYVIFKLVMPTSMELRHFFAAMPALAGLCAGLFVNEPGKGGWRNRTAAAAMILAIGLNLLHASRIPKGVVGYESVGCRLAALDKSGNILLCCEQDQDLIFRYRTWDPNSKRSMLRGDRTLAIRLPGYARVEAVQLVRNKEELLALIRRGRVRYLVTSCPADGIQSRAIPEFALAHDIAGSQSSDFRLIERLPLLVQFGRTERRYSIHIWEYLHDLPDGPSELEVRIPTARMTLSPRTAD